MKIKAKLVKKQVQQLPENPLEVNYSEAFEESNKFLFDYRAYQYSVPQLRTFLSQEYRRIFPNRPYPDGVSMKLVYLAIAYEIQHRCYLKAKLPIPPRVKQNYEAAIAFKTDKLDMTSRSIIEYQLQQEKEGEKTMKTAKAVPVRKAPKPSAEMKAAAQVKGKKETEQKEKRVTVAGAYIACFEAIAKGKKMTDKQIAETVNKQCGKDHNEANAAASRAAYNRGTLSGQSSKPKTAVEKYEPKAAK